MSIQKFKAIGLMSGTSLDGLDIAYCIFERNETEWSFGIENAISISYSEEWKSRLREAFNASALELIALDHDLGTLHGKWVKSFIDTHQLSVDFVASHGHTVFHQPEKGITVQIGHPSKIAAVTGLTVVADFRTLDVALGGQGAPLVPIGDRLLFSQYDACLNLGGIANISFEKNNERIAFDIAPCNMLWNVLSQRLGMDFDKDGELARSGKVRNDLLEKWNGYSFYTQEAPKSLGREFFESHFAADLKAEADISDLMATATEHIADQIATVVNAANIKKLLVSGGGARNIFFIEKLKEKCPCEVIIPEELLLDFKEALVFAFLGVLRISNQINTLSSVTGASRDSIGGSVWIGD
ncbi:MAG: anhydro-N-acetylmuramic acid kinase [Flavobacteriales bacterium]